MSGEPEGRSKAFSGVVPAAERVTELSKELPAVLATADVVVL